MWLNLTKSRPWPRPGLHPQRVFQESRARAGRAGLFICLKRSCFYFASFASCGSCSSLHNVPPSHKANTTARYAQDAKHAKKNKEGRHVWKPHLVRIKMSLLSSKILLKSFFLPKESCISKAQTPHRFFCRRIRRQKIPERNRTCLCASVPAPFTPLNSVSAEPFNRGRSGRSYWGGSSECSERVANLKSIFTANYQE